MSGRCIFEGQAMTDHAMTDHATTDHATTDHATIDFEPAQTSEAGNEPSRSAECSIPSSLTGTIIATAPFLALAACGGGDSGSTGTPPPPPPPVVVAPTSTQASRFLAQSSMGSSRADVDAVVSTGYDSWIANQLAMPRAITFWDWLVGAGYNNATNINTENGYNSAVWRQLISGQDQLRQRVGMALLDFIVVGIDGLTTNWKAFAQAAFMDVLWDNAFGNYRDLMEKFTLIPAMGLWLTFLGNKKANTVAGTQPDENFARELMQLFTLGLYKLNADGTQQPIGNSPVETYNQDDVSGLARVLTGFTFDSTVSTIPDRLRRPMTQVATDHETGASTFLGTTVPAGTDGFGALKIALDAIFAHQNIAPFVSKQLIQHLVTSNPSAAYIGRVSAAFANNGSGVRGDMKAVIHAILMDPEARSDANISITTFGKLRAPVMRLTNWARAFAVASPSDTWAIGDTSSPFSRLAESPGHSQSVFNFFRPGYTPPHTAIATQGLVAPEFQITNEPSVIAYINYMQSLIQSGTGDVRADYTSILTKASDSAALIDEINIVLAASELSAVTVATIRTAVDSIGTTTSAMLSNRVYTAILLVMASPDYLAQK